MKRLRILTALLIATLLLPVSVVLQPRSAEALPNDIALFASGFNGASFAPPNILIVFDTSMTMRDALGGPVNDPAADPMDSKWWTARRALLNFIQQINPPDGAGGFVQNARFGLMFYDKSEFGGRLVVPIADDNTGAIIARMTTGWSRDDDTHSGTPMAGSLADIGRYYAGDTPWGDLPQFGPPMVMQTDPFEPNEPSPMDLECRQSYIIMMTDGLDTGQKMDKYGGADAANYCNTIGDSDGDDDVGGPLGDLGKLESECGKAVLDTWSDDIAYSLFRTDLKGDVPGMQNVTVHGIAFDLATPGVFEKAVEQGGGRSCTRTTTLRCSTRFSAWPS